MQIYFFHTIILRVLLLGANNIKVNKQKSRNDESETQELI